LLGLKRKTPLLAVDVVSFAYLAEAVGGSLKPSTDAKEVKVFKVNEIPEKLAFDHEDVLRDGIKSMQTQK